MPAGRLPKGNGKAIIFSAPSGAGKSTLVSNLMSSSDLELGFSVSATTRELRGDEVHGESYYFISQKDFADRVADDAFVEWEEVYPGLSYGTLCEEVERLWAEGVTPVFDVDVVGGQTLKSVFKERGLAIFVVPPSIEELERRLRSRGTDSEESIVKRIGKASREMSAAPAFDVQIINDKLDRAVQDTIHVVKAFLS